MKLRDRVLEGLAEMAIGDNAAFPYRSSSRITRFFDRCGLSYVHDGTTRKWWTKAVLEELNVGPNHSADLPSDAILLVISEMFDPDDFDTPDKTRDVALVELNNLIARDGLAAYFDPSGRCYVRNTGNGVNSSTLSRQPRPLSKEEIAQRKRVAAFLDSASEDEFTEKLLVPLFQRLGFH